MPYKDLNHALKLFRRQVSESIPYAIESLPKFNTPEEAFNYLKLRTRYKKDPKGRELFQTLPTLLENNWHGITGHGDCDCFTIAALAVLIANGFNDCGIVLVGRNPLVPVHIYAYVDIDGKREYFDLTNKVYNYERFYPYKQHIPYKINQNEKDMILELAEGLSARPKFVNVKSYTRSKTVNAHKRKFPSLSEELSDFLSLKPKAKKNIKKYAKKAVTIYGKTPAGKLVVKGVNKGLKYIPMRKSGVQVREDYFDGMSANEFQNKCLSEGVTLEELEELSSRRAQRRIERQQTKATVKVAKQEKKGTKQQAKAVRKGAKTGARMDRKVQRQDNRATNKQVKTTSKIAKKQQKVAVKASKPRNVKKLTPVTPPQQNNSFAPPEDNWMDVVNQAMTTQTQPQFMPESQYEQIPEEEQIEVEEVTPEQEYEEGVEDMFMGEARVLNFTVPKLLLWGTGLTLLSAAAGYAIANKRR